MGVRRSYGDAAEFFSTPTRGFIGLNSGRLYAAVEPGNEPVRGETNEEYAARLVIHDAQRAYEQQARTGSHDDCLDDKVERKQEFLSRTHKEPTTPTRVDGGE